MPEDRSDQARAAAHDSRRVEQEIRGLAGVLSCRVVVNKEGEILEIHVVSSSERHPKQIIRDIETVLLASLGIRVDHKKISVAQIPASRHGDGKPSAPTTAGVPRIRFVALHNTWTPDGGEVEVVLESGGFQGTGRASFAASTGPLRAVVEAALLAVGRFVREGAFQFGAVQEGNLGGHAAVFVQVEHFLSGRSVPLLGSALVLRERSLSALLATLDAVNRTIGRLEPMEGVEWVAGPEPGRS